MDFDEFVQPGITETTPKSAPDQLSNCIKEPRMEWITREDGMLVCTLCTGRDHREYKETDALRKHWRASHPAKEGLGTNPRVHTEEFLCDAFEVAGIPAACQEGVDMVLRILQGTVKRDKNSLNNDSYEEDLANVLVAPLHNEDPVNNPLIQSAIATGNLRRIALDFFLAEEFGVLVCISCGILVDASSCWALVQKYHSQVDRSTRLIASRALLNLNVVTQPTPLWNNKVILERIDRDNNKLASFTPIPGVCVQDGFQCRGCGYHCCKSNPAARSTSPKQVKVQSIVMPYYGLHGYWVVQMAPLAPYSSDLSLQLTEMQKASLQMLLADAFTSVPALKLSEELPPWILGCDFHHVDPRHRSGQKINERITWKDVVGEKNQDIGLGFNRKELGKTMVAYHKALPYLLLSQIHWTCPLIGELPLEMSLLGPVARVPDLLSRNVGTSAHISSAAPLQLYPEAEGCLNLFGCRLPLLCVTNGPLQGISRESIWEKLLANLRYSTYVTHPKNALESLCEGSRQI
ncbi:hypothetical protein BJ742DRAFT_743227 [Cladochytrium replicatum]|nr:hypothetical protein BJ742DRAFT_743227 [Cladochytrium replicatum]